MTFPGPHISAVADVVTKAPWFKTHENLEHTYVLFLSRFPPQVAELVNNLEIELVDLSDVKGDSKGDYQ